MITAVDTNILIDILEGDTEFGAASSAAHATCQADCLLTRDDGFHRKHFTGLEVKTPATDA